MMDAKIGDSVAIFSFSKEALHKSHSLENFLNVLDDLPRPWVRSDQNSARKGFIHVVQVNFLN